MSGAEDDTPKAPGEGTLLRLFCAVELPAGVRELVGRYISTLRERFGDVRAGWERPEKLHLTLKFVGEVEAERAARLSAAAARAAQSHAPFELALSGTGVFPPKGPPRVLWLGVVDEGGRLAALQQSLEEECAAEGFARERRPFRPHLTIVRLREPAGAHRLADCHKGSSFTTRAFTVPELAVIRSELGPGGSRHTALSRHALGAGDEV